MSDSQYRWLVLGYTLVIQAVSVGILIYCFALFAVPWLEEFDSSRRDVMLAVSLLQITMGLVSPFIGRAMDRVPMRALVLGGLVALVIGLLLASLATAWWQLLLVYATLFPMTMALMGTLASQTLMTRWFDDKRGLAIGVSAMGTNVGGIVFPWLTAGLLLDIGWRDTFLWLAAIAVVLVGPLTWWVLGRQPPERRIESLAASGGAAPAGPTDREWTTREILATPMFWIPLIAIVPLNIAFAAVQFNIGAFANDLGFGDQAAMLIMLCAVSMVLGKIFFGGLGDRLDHRLLYWISAGVSVAGLWILTGAPSFTVTVVGIVLIGLSGGSILPMLGIIFGSRFGVASFGRVMGIVMLAITAGALGPIMAGWVYDTTGSYDGAFLGSAALFLPGAIVMAWLPSR